MCVFVLHSDKVDCKTVASIILVSIIFLLFDSFNYDSNLRQPHSFYAQIYSLFFHLRADNGNDNEGHDNYDDDGNDNDGDDYNFRPLIFFVMILIYADLMYTKS